MPGAGAVTMTSDPFPNISPRWHAHWRQSALALLAISATAWACASAAMAGPLEDCSQLRAAAAIAPCSLVIDDKAQTPSAHVTALLMRARAEIDMSDLDRAEADIKAAFALHATPFGYRVRGRLHALRGRNREAREDYSQAIAISESKVAKHTSYVDRGNFLFRISEVPAALADFEVAIQLDPTKAAPYVGRALTHKARGKISEALADLSQAKTVEPNYWLTYVELGDILVAQKRFADAIAAFDLALKLRPNDRRAVTGRAAAAALASNTSPPAASPAPETPKPPALATPSTDTPAAPMPPSPPSPTIAQPAPSPQAPAVAPSPTPPAEDPAAKQAEERRGKLKEAFELRQKGKHQEAIAIYDALLHQTPSDAEVALLKGRALMALLKWKEALDLLKAVSDSKTAPPAIKALALEGQGEVLARNNLFPAAIAVTTAALQVNPKLGDALFWRGIALYSTGVFDKAIADFKQAASLMPKSSLYPAWEAIALVTAGELQKGREAIDRALAMQADNAFALTARARLRLSSGEIEAAEADIRKLTQQGPLNPVALQTQQLIMIHKLMKASDQPLDKPHD